MNKSIISFAKSVFAGITFIAMSAAVQATPISYTYDSDNGHLLSTIFGSPQHRLEYDLTSKGYDPSIDTLTSLNLTLNFDKVIPSFRKLSFDTPFGSPSSIYNSWTEATFAMSNIDLNGYSLGSGIELTLTSWLSSVYLTGYTLTFSGTRDLAEAVAVPTPSSLALLSAGLLGAGWFSRRRTKLANS